MNFIEKCSFVGIDPRIKKWLLPKCVMQSEGVVQNAEALLKNKSLQIALAEPDMTVLKNAYNRLSEKEEFILHNVDDCEKAVENIIRMYYDFLANDEKFVNMIMWENLNRAEYMKKAEGFEMLKNPLLTSLHKILEMGKKEKTFRDDINEEQLAVLLITSSFSYFSNIHTLSYLMKTNLTDKTKMEKRVEMVISMILDFIRA